MCRAANLFAFYEAIETSPDTVFNPWTQHASDDRDAGSLARRRTNLQSHLAIDDPLLVLVGEAPGYQGCRVTGVPFTSERLIASGAIPRVREMCLSSRFEGWAEPSTTSVWQALYALAAAERAILWNACPWHPPGQQNPLSNRAPTKTEIEAGQPALRALARLFPAANFVAVGVKAAWAINAAVDSERVVGNIRHPSYGGAPQFRAGLKRALNVIAAKA